ncbi:MAG: hypothetical protein QOG44_2414, partial [Acidimicrobiaceae bacterium]|nr:hypothetical protein [Acidimicrobiaceae bacterium]
YPVLRLPPGSAFDRHPGMEDVMPGEADHLGRIDGFGSMCDRVTEDDLKAPGADRAELVGRGESKIDFE